MASKNITQTGTGSPLGVRGDVIGGLVLAVLGLLHLFVLEIAGVIGILLLLLVWPLIAGGIGTYLDYMWYPDRAADLSVVGAVTGVLAAVVTVLVVLITGWIGTWSAFIFNTFGVDLAVVTFGMAIIFAITWTVFGFVGGTIVRKILI